jgi:mono/diheme cytochrome c family protein
MATSVESVPPVASTEPLSPPATPAPDSYKGGNGSDNARGKLVFEGGCVSCHGWTGQSAISLTATLTGAAAVNDPSGTNDAQIVLSGTKRLTPDGALSMPAFGAAYSDDEIAAVANYVTARFGVKGSTLTAQDIAALRKQVAN